MLLLSTVTKISIPYSMYHRPLIGLKYHYVISYLTTETHAMKTRLEPLNILADLVVAEGGVLCTRSHDIGHIGSTGSWRLWKFDWNIVSSKFGEITKNASYVYLSPKYSGPNGFVSKLRRSHDDIKKKLIVQLKTLWKEHITSSKFIR